MIECEIQNPSAFKTLPETVEIQRWVDASIQSSDVDFSLVIRIVDEAESQELNNTYRQKNYATNVLSFPYEMEDFDIPELAEQTKHIGDLVLCEPVVKKEAEQQNKTLLQHWAHMIIHGMLHLQGYDHLNDTDAEIMESLEVTLLKQLGFENPYHSSNV